VAHNGLRASSSPPSYVCRSADFGKTWAPVDTFANCDRPHMAAGAGNHIYLSGVPSQAYWRGWVVQVISTNWGGNGSWKHCSFQPDSGYTFDAAVSPAFTLPPGSATVWSAYSHVNMSTSTYEILAMHTTDAGDNWYGPTTICHLPGRDAGYVDLKNYNSVGNTYMNIVYWRDNNVYHHWVNAPTPTVWSDSFRVNKTYYSPIGIDVGPQLCYSPGGGSGGGAVWMSTDSTRILWNSGWMTGIGAGSIAPEPAGIMRVTPNPGYARLQFDWSEPARSLSVYDGTGRLVRRFDATAARSFAWDRTTENGRSVSAGVYLARLETEAGTVTRSFVLR